MEGLGKCIDQITRDATKNSVLSFVMCSLVLHKTKNMWHSLRKEFTKSHWLSFLGTHLTTQDTSQTKHNLQLTQNHQYDTLSKQWNH